MPSAADAFLDMDGEMPSLIRNFDWTNTSLGDPATWPPILKTSLGIILRSGFPMFISWGPDMLCFYNDAYRESLGNDGKHPVILGMCFRDAWADLWDLLTPLVDEVINNGKTVRKDNLPFPMVRNGKSETCYWTFSYSALTDEVGKIMGLIVTCIETTQKVKMFQALEEKHQQLNFALDAAELGTFDYNVRTNKFTANSRLTKWFNLPEGEDFDLSLALHSITDRDRNRVEAQIQKSFDPASDGRYQVEYSLKAQDGEGERSVLANGRVFFDSEQQAMRMSGTIQDITVLKKLAGEKEVVKKREQQIIAREKLKAQEAERTQLASELHDNICQILAAVKMQLSFYNNEVGTQSPIIQNCMKHIDEALIETRDISHRMVMPRFAEVSLNNALANLVTIYHNDKRTIDIYYDGDHLSEMPLSHKEALYRISQEQLNNIEKYSKADNVELILNFGDYSVGLIIRDNGIGFDTNTTSSGIGLTNIRNRAEILDGKIEIVSSPGEGCCLLVQLPL
ncbi:MAG: ATP-binding protein [Flavitalea sp.]